MYLVLMFINVSRVDDFGRVSDEEDVRRLSSSLPSPEHTVNAAG